MASAGTNVMGASHRAIRSSGKPHSCAECRRLKLRCDRVFPCESCRKRNVAALCPNGSLPPRPRLLAEDAVKLSKTIAELTNRCRHLEDALRTLQAKHSTESHPLLDPELLTSPHASEHQATSLHDATRPDDDSDDLDSVQDSLGTLTIDSLGNSNFLGRTAGMHMLLQSDDTEVTDLLPPEIQNIASEALPARVLFSNLSDRKSAVTEHMLSYLPPTTKAWSLCEIYFEHAAWLCHPIARDQFINEIFGPVYNPPPSTANGDHPQTQGRPESYEVALLFMVFSLATLLDLTLPPNNVEAEFYHQLARAGLSCDPILVEPTVPAIQTLILMSFYHWLGNRKHSEQVSWAILGLLVNLSQNVGLHRDSAAWRLLEPKMVERQRLLFWELYAMELTQALNFGRPPSFSLSTIDCKMPADATQFAFSNDDLDPPFHSIKYRYFSIYLSPVIDAILGAKTANYPTILALDRKVRDQDLAPLIEFDTSRAPGDPIVDLTGSSLGVTMQKFMIVAWPHLTLLYLHRGYFVRALSDHQQSQDLLEGRYAPSVLAIFRTSCVMIAMLQALERVNGELAKRFWLYWCHGLAAAIVVGSIVAKAPNSPLAQPALEQINAAFALFDRAAHQQTEAMGRPAKALAVVTRLRYRAHQAFARYHASKHGGAALPPEIADNCGAHDEELHILGGHTRIVSGRASATPSASNSTQSPSSTGSPDGPYHRSSPKNSAPRGFTPEALDKAHPSLLADLRSTKEIEPVVPTQQAVPTQQQAVPAQQQAGPSAFKPTPLAGGYEQHSYPQPKFPVSHINTSGPGPRAAAPPAVDPWAGSMQPNPNPPPQSLGASGCVPAPSDTHAAFAMIGGDPAWDMQWHSFMDQLGMFSNEPNPNAVYAAAQLKQER
ncbi:fungal-specific transcription factor domain-containing protein [Gautieria morchelliformis]|nr:fungal-specific transcription factor domain-containing protein [Gautieria morchelliformis]